MENTNQNQAENCSEEFSRAQQQALAIWARSLSDHRLEVTRNQLMHAIVRGNPDKDDAMTGFALIARMEAVTAENQRRGIITAKAPLCIPWVPPTDGPLQTQTVNPQAVTVVHFPTFAHIIADNDNPDAPPTVINHPTATYFINPDNAPNNPQPVDADLYAALQNLTDADIQEIHAAAAASRLDNHVTVHDWINDEAEAERYRLADNDASGLPIISCETIEVDHNVWDIVHPVNTFPANDSSSAIDAAAEQFVDFYNDSNTRDN